MFKNNRNRIMSFLLAFLMILAPIANLSVFAKDADSYVNLRVEGNNYTILEKTRIKLGDLEKNLDLSDYGLDKEFEEPTAFHALVFGLENYTDLDLKSEDDFESMVSNFGIYIKNIDGLKAATDGKPNSGWGYMVNNEGPAVGMDGFKVNDGNDIVVYYQEDWQDIKQSYFNKEEVEVGQNKEFTLKLEGIGFDESFNPVKEAIEGAEILINNKATGVKTGKDGSFILSIPRTGEYNLSAVRKNSEGIINITRPFAKISVVESDQVYRDQDKISAWAFDEVMEATEKEFVNGNEEGDFLPQNEISRSEFVKIIMEALDFDMEDNLENVFTDIKENQWFYKYAVNANKLGIIEGHDNKFMPYNKITRQEMAVIIVNALEQKGLELDSSNKLDFEDRNKVASWALDEVDKISSLELMQGHNNKFMPLDRATRETATLTLMRVYRILENTEIDPELPEENPEEKPEEKPEEIEDIDKLVKKTGDWIYSKNPSPEYGSEWFVLSMARSNMDLDQEYFNSYYKNLENFIEKKEGIINETQYTDYSKVVLVLTSMGKDPRNIGGYNLLEPLADFNMVKKQGINGSVFALIALDSKNYEVPKDLNFEKITTRDALIDDILDQEKEAGGWAFSKKEEIADVDMTAMTLQALAPYYNKRADVKEAVDRALVILSDMQEESGGYKSWGNENSFSTSQVIIALTALDIDPHKDSRFIKNNVSVVDDLLSYQDESGGFYGLKDEEKPSVNPAATDQAMRALVSYNRFVREKNSYYDMADVN